MLYEIDTIYLIADLLKGIFVSPKRKLKQKQAAFL